MFIYKWIYYGNPFQEKYDYQEGLIREMAKNLLLSFDELALSDILTIF